MRPLIILRKAMTCMLCIKALIAWVLKKANHLYRINDENKKTLAGLKKMK
jgi:hypothetical protein